MLRCAFGAKFRLYWDKSSDGSDFTPKTVERRVRMNRLVEVMQIKGNSECQIDIQRPR
ncbi:DUF3604 domain-containing protein [Pseudoalteromonas sp. GB56]